MIPDRRATKVNMEVSVGIFHTHQTVLLNQWLLVWTAETKLIQGVKSSRTVCVPHNFLFFQTSTKKYKVIHVIWAYFFDANPRKEILSHFCLLIRLLQLIEYYNLIKVLQVIYYKCISSQIPD